MIKGGEGITIFYCEKILDLAKTVESIFKV